MINCKKINLTIQFFISCAVILLSTNAWAVNRYAVIPSGFQVDILDTRTNTLSTPISLPGLATGYFTVSYDGL